MPWFKIDDAFHGHPKVMELTPAAVGVWTLSGTWCANYLTDGEIKASVVRRLGGTPEMIQELVDAGLWIDNGGSYQFKDWEDYQPMKADVEAEREAARERMRTVRAKKKGVGTSSEQPPPVQPNNPGTFERTAPEVRVTPTQPVPARPDPANKESDPGKPDARTPEHRATDDAYEKTGKAFNFIATRQIAKWAINDRAKTEAEVSEAIVAAYQAGKPITKTVLGQYFDGIQRQAQSKPTTMDRMQQTALLGMELQEQATNYPQIGA